MPELIDDIEEVNPETRFSKKRRVSREFRPPKRAKMATNQRNLSVSGTSMVAFLEEIEEVRPSGRSRGLVPRKLAALETPLSEFELKAAIGPREMRVKIAGRVVVREGVASVKAKSENEEIELVLADPSIIPQFEKPESEIVLTSFVTLEPGGNALLVCACRHHSA